MNFILSRDARKPDFCLVGENKGADQLRSNCEADQRATRINPEDWFSRIGALLMFLCSNLHAKC